MQGIRDFLANFLTEWGFLFKINTCIKSCNNYLFVLKRLVVFIILAVSLSLLLMLISFCPPLMMSLSIYPRKRLSLKRMICMAACA